MFRTLVAFYTRITNRISLAIVAIVTLLLVIFIVPAVYGQFSPGGIPCRALDTLFTYTPDQAKTVLACFGPLLGKYRLAELTLDLVYPVVYSLFFSMALTALVRDSSRLLNLLQYLLLFPLLAWFFDLLENASISVLIAQYPDFSPLVAQMASLSTSLKWICVGLNVLIIIGLGLYRTVWAGRKRFFSSPN
uniref:Uncharacterized protein n=1 Tax=Gracilinema caldarium TaxID=215591 RepID=A0A7C3E2V8_9SPIR